MDRAQEVKERAARLKQARELAGFETLQAVYDKFGKTPGFKRNSYKSHENGNGAFSFPKAKDYAGFFNVRAEWLYDGTPPMKDPPPRSPAGAAVVRFKGNANRGTVPLVGYVAAGAEAHYVSDGGLGEVEAPDGANDDTVAVEVRGTSLGPLFEHWLVFYDEVRSPVTPDLLGRLCIVGLADGRVLVKQIQKARGGRDLYHLFSNNEPPLVDQVVAWAARVRSMTPR